MRWCNLVFPYWQLKISLQIVCWLRSGIDSGAEQHESKADVFTKYTQELLAFLLLFFYYEVATFSLEVSESLMTP